VAYQRFRIYKPDGCNRKSCIAQAPLILEAINHNRRQQDELEEAKANVGTVRISKWNNKPEVPLLARVRIGLG
jgi:hypothetical protein